MIRRELRATLRLRSGDRVEREIPGAEWVRGTIAWPNRVAIMIDGRPRQFQIERMVGGRVRYLEERS